MSHVIDRSSGLIDADRSWILDLEHVFSYGNRSAPRGMLVYETLAMQSVVSMENPIIYNKKRELGYKFMAAEAAWILQGRNDVASIAPFSKEISKFSDDGQTFFGAYGPPLMEQMRYAVDAILFDMDTRQSVITIWRQNPPKSKDVPCTVALQWLARNGVLHCVASMRSSDLWLGHPYDIFNFSAISCAMIIELNRSYKSAGIPALKLGNLHLTAGSKHIYERNIEKVGEIIEAYKDGEHDMLRNTIPLRPRVFDWELYDTTTDFIDHLWDAANSPRGALSI